MGEVKETEKCKKKQKKTVKENNEKNKKWEVKETLKNIGTNNVKRILEKHWQKTF